MNELQIFENKEFGVQPINFIPEGDIKWNA